MGRSLDATGLEEQAHRDVSEKDLPPGTVYLEAERDAADAPGSVVLHPTPSDDPNDPLNWPVWRKAVHLAIVLVYVILTFAQLAVAVAAWGPMRDELGLADDDLTGSMAVGFAGLGAGSLLLVPLAHKYGRRPVYLLSAATQFAAVFWLGQLPAPGAGPAGLLSPGAGLWLASHLAGLGGAACVSIAQISFSDVFFVHQHGAVNACYMLATGVGAYLGPVAAGYIVDAQGWRWVWWWAAILMGTQLLSITLTFEESKFTARVPEARPGSAVGGGGGGGGAKDVDFPDDEYDYGDAAKKPVVEETTTAAAAAPAPGELERTASRHRVDPRIPVRPYLARLRLVTPTPGPLFHDPLGPFRMLVTFAAVAYAALTFGSLIALFSVLTSVQAATLIEPPYSFGATGIGLMNLAPFVGSLPGAYIGGPLNDRLIVGLARRNGGLYEPEMRLWFMLPAALLIPLSLLMVGIGIANGVDWPVLAVGYGIFGFVLTAGGGIGLSYALDCYSEIIGTAMTGIVFTQNALAVAVLFALNPWVRAMGLRDVHVCLAAVSFVVLLLPLPLLKWGKAARARSAGRYRAMAAGHSPSREG